MNPSVKYRQNIMKRCVSKCSGIKEEACKEPCSFVGKKYCRLSTLYKMEPPGCEVVKKDSLKDTLKMVKPATKPATKAVTKPATKAVTKPMTKPATKAVTKPATNPVTKPVNQIEKQLTRARTLKASKPKKSMSVINEEKDTLIDTVTKTVTKPVTKPVKKTTRTKVKTAPNKSNRVTRNKVSGNKVIRSWSLKKSNPDYFHAKTIQTFMKKTEERRKALFYGTICTDSGVCIALGKERQALLNFFKFDTFEHAKEPYKSVGTPSANGFVKELKYEREGYIAYALMKSSLKPRSDNLAYEYLVGKYLNEVSKKLPNFVETYGLFHYPSTKERDEMKLNHRFTRPVVPFDPNDMKNVCRKAQNMCVLTQYLKETKSFLHHYGDSYFRKHFSPYVFYQIYFTLHRLRKEFTHYDLHPNNVLLYEPIDGQYIQYHYHCDDKTVSFKSKYIVKIIDYGRCFFKNSLEYYTKICAEKTCEPLCGIKKGFSTFHMDRTLDRFSGFSNSAFKNESQDLLLLYDTYLHSKVITDDSLDTDYRKILSDTIYLKGMFTTRFNGKTFDKKFGTIEDLKKSDKIHNVTDACERWEEYILHPDRVQSNENDYLGQRCLGELHIYTDGRDLEFNIDRDPFTNID